MCRFAFFVLPILIAIACASDDQIVAQDIVSEIRWSAPETTRYLLLNDDEVIGSGELTLVTRGDVLILNQIFEIRDDEISDHVAVEADPETLRPMVVRRVIDGPEGKRECEATYADGNVTVEQQSEEDERSDELPVPDKSYDTWSDLFLWRTLPFADGFEIKYAGVLSCSLAKPDLISEVLTVKRMEMVTVPAGTFEAWRLEIRSGGRTQKAWYANDDVRTLVRYDNGDLVFELESID